MKNSNPEEKISALMALAKECGATVYAHRTSPHEPAVAFSPSAWEAFSARAAVEASASALAAMPASYGSERNPSSVSQRGKDRRCNDHRETTRDQVNSAKSNTTTAMSQTMPAAVMGARPRSFSGCEQ